MSDIYDIIARNPETTKAYVEQAIEPVEESLEELHQKVDQLLPKKKKDREILPLRDPLNSNLFPLFLTNAGYIFVYQKDLKRSQLRIAYTVLYHVGLRINEIRELTEQDLTNAIAASQFNVVHHKTSQAHIHVLSKRAVEDLKHLKDDFITVFEKYKYKYLFGKEKPMHEKSLITMINRDLKNTCTVADLPYNIKSHSFRINVISNLLKITTVQNVADIIGHDDIRSTISYRRYALSKEEIQELLQRITDD